MQSYGRTIEKEREQQLEMMKRKLQLEKKRKEAILKKNFEVIKSEFFNQISLITSNLFIIIYNLHC